MIALAQVAEAIMEAAGAALPELDFVRDQGVAAPVLGAGDGLVLVLSFDFGGAGLEVGAVWDDLALSGCDGTDLMAARPGGKVAFGFFVRQFPDQASGGDLALAGGPKETNRGAIVLFQLLAFATLVVGVKVEATIIKAFQEDDAGGRHATVADGGQGHGIGLGELMGKGVVQPIVKQDEGITGGGRFVERI